MNAQILLQEAKKRGVKVEMFEGKLAAVRSPGLTADFSATLREHRFELIAWLNAQHVAKQISLGEFDCCDGTTAAKLLRVLKEANHPFILPALKRLLHEA
jgi:glutathionylspermidine synthase